MAASLWCVSCHHTCAHLGQAVSACRSHVITLGPPRSSRIIAIPRETLWPGIFLGGGWEDLGWSIQARCLQSVSCLGLSGVSIRLDRDRELLVGGCALRPQSCSLGGTWYRSVPLLVTLWVASSCFFSVKPLFSPVCLKSVSWAASLRLCKYPVSYHPFSH